MIKSMTGYYRASSKCSLGKCVLEIQSVNRKMLDFSIYLPKDCLSFESEIRKWLTAHLERGQITVRFSLQKESTQDSDILNTAQQLKSLKSGWEKICTEIHCDPREITLAFLVGQLEAPPLFKTIEEEEELKIALKEAVQIAVQGLIKAKEVEGNAIASDLLLRLKIIEEATANVEQRKEFPLIHFQKRIQERLKEFGGLPGEIEERASREVALLVDRMDITEEIVRLRAHISQFRKHLLTEEKAIGRTLDFLIQEMHREINTLGSKSSDSEISSSVVKMKSELEKIREQVQNIE